MRVEHDDSAGWGRKAFKAAALFVGIFIVTPFIAFVVYDMATANSSRRTTVSTPNAATSSDNQPPNTDNLRLQNECIANAQAIVNNDPLSQPVGGNPTSQSLAASNKAFKMQPKIADCQARYPAN